MNEWPSDREVWDAFQLIAMRMVPDRTPISRADDLAHSLYGEWKKFKTAEKENEK